MPSMGIAGDARWTSEPQSSDPAASDDARGLRLVTYNIRWGLGADGVHDLDRTAAVLRLLDADIVLLNETDVNWRRSGNVDQPAYLAEAAGYPYMYFAPALRTRASGGRGASLYGNTLLSRHPIAHAETVPLPVPLGREPRAALVAQVVAGGKRLTVVGTHLGLSQRERTAQTARLAEIVTGRPGPVVLMGDFNALPGSPEMAQLLAGPAGLVDAHEFAGRWAGLTFPAGAPSARIDYVLVSADLADRIVAAQAHAADASDHLPIVVELAWP